MNWAGCKKNGGYGCNIHTPRASRHPPALLQAFELALAGVLGLALHEVIVVVLAPRADEEGGGQQGGRAGAELLDLGDRVRERSGVDKVLVVEPALPGQPQRFGRGVM